MPYKIVERDDEFCVVKSDTSETKKCYSKRGDALAYMRALYANVGDAKSTSERSYRDADGIYHSQAHGLVLEAKRFNWADWDATHKKSPKEMDLSELQEHVAHAAEGLSNDSKPAQHTALAHGLMNVATRYGSDEYNKLLKKHDLGHPAKGGWTPMGEDAGKSGEGTKAEPSAGKELWQMSRDEYRKSTGVHPALMKIVENMHDLTRKGKLPTYGEQQSALDSGYADRTYDDFSRKNIITLNENGKALASAHLHAVTEALKAGKSVPEEAYKGYTHLNNQARNSLGVGKDFSKSKSVGGS